MMNWSVQYCLCFIDASANNPNFSCPQTKAKHKQYCLVFGQVSCTATHARNEFLRIVRRAYRSRGLGRTRVALL
jgi:hypothetical protein